MKYIITVLITCSLLINCSKIQVSEGTPKCIKKLIRNGDEITKVDRYLFQDSEVYVLSDGGGCCDKSALVVNNDCEVIGSLGGFDGNTVINGVEFSEAEFIEQVY